MALPTNRYFLYPFAVDGVQSAVPNPTDPGGTVTYQQGFGDRYTRQLGVDPAALPYPEPEHNSILFDITLALQAVQQWGIPRFITPDDNAPGDPPVPTPFPYSIWAFALFDDGVNGPRIYQSLENLNVAEPDDATKWGLRDNTAGKITLDNSVFQTGVADGDMVYWNSSINKFDLAVANGTAAQQVIGVADVTNLRVCSFGSLTLFSGLTPGATYYLSTTTPGDITATQPSGFTMELGVALTATTLFLKSASEISSDIPTGTGLPWFSTGSVPAGFLLGDGSAVSRTTYAALFAVLGTTWGPGDGSTTFNLPDTRGRSPLGSGTGSGLTARTVGQTGGEELHVLSVGELAEHAHSYTNVAFGGNQNGAGGGGTSWGPSDQTINTGNTGLNDGHNTMHPYYVASMIIKT
jgi:hypothetical protein